MKKRYRLFFCNSVFAVLVLSAFAVTASSQSKLTDAVVESKKFSQNKIGISAKRNITVYLPEHYHVYSNQAFTHKLEEFGIPHEAEEYNGGWGDKQWGEQGRVYRDMLPFFNEHLVFESSGVNAAAL